ncbi:MAG: SAP domain-containing protein [Deltaproteobacteria bacterium]|nr:SAP domain-containing protein [Deltaproteobacteria bacterium]
MHFNGIRKMAKEMNISTYRMKKPDIIRAIQRTENNPECYGTVRIQDCNEPQCLWRTECVVHNGGQLVR